MSDARDRRVLVVDNDPHFRRAVQKLISAKGYTVFAASNLVEAKELATKERVHAAVLDIRLKHDRDEDDMSGLVLAVQLDPLIVKIILSAYPSVEAVRRSYGDVSAFTFVEKEEAPSKLFEELKQAFAEKVQINFDLSIRWQGIDVGEVAREIEMELKPNSAVLEAEIEEALCKLFFQSDEVLVTRLIPVEGMPCTSQSGAVLLKVQPRYPGSGWGAPMVVKLATRDKIAVEAVNYERAVDRFIAGFRHTRIYRMVETHLLAGIIYTLVGTPLDECMDLGTFYVEHSPSETVEVLNGLFLEICQLWYDNRRPRRTRDMMELYAKPLKLSAERLEATLMESGLSDWRTDGQKHHWVPSLKRRFVNPIEWLRRHPRLPTQASVCFTHGDMHSRNVLIDRDHHAWLIDFYRTGLGHLFRDLIELESDVKFTLLEVTDLPSLLRFESALLNAEHFSDAPTSPSFREPELKKAFQVVQGIRHIAGQLAEPGADMLDYYQGLLLQTLAMIRLRHVPPPKKQHAYLAAALLCERLEEW